MSKTHLLTDEELAKIITISIKGFAETIGINLPGSILIKINNKTLEAINLFGDDTNSQNETFAQEFVRIYNEDTINT